MQYPTVSSAPGGVTITDPSGDTHTYTKANDALMYLLGWQRSPSKLTQLQRAEQEGWHNRAISVVFASQAH